MKFLHLLWFALLHRDVVCGLISNDPEASASGSTKHVSSEDNPKKKSSGLRRNLEDGQELKDASSSPATTSTSSYGPIEMAPSIGPTLAPQVPVTMDLTAVPSIGPSVAPEDPSLLPSITPSNLASSLTSARPSTAPFSEPSTEPSAEPSTIVKSELPSSLPSTDPSTLPSTRPSLLPSTEPSAEPSSASEIKNSAFVVELPLVSSSDVKKVMDWIKHGMTREKTTFCWRDSYVRDVGQIPTSCPSGKELIGGFCYSKCPADCHSVCPQGMDINGLFCRKSEYGRGTGYGWQPVEPFNNNGMLRRCRNKHGSCEMWGWVVYPKCKSGYHPAGCCVCRPSIPNCKALGLENGIDLSCAKRVIIGDPTLPTCSSSMVNDAGLCYPRCKHGFHGVAFVCWSDCGSTQVDCGAACGKSTEECVAEVAGQVLGPLIMAGNVLTLRLAAPATNALQTIMVAGKMVAGSSRLGKAFVKLARQLDKIKAF